MAEFKVYVPDEIKDYAPDLEYFVSTMVRKLHTNRHKGTSSDLDPNFMLTLAQKEHEEAEKALDNEGQFEFGVECVDAANMYFLAARGAWQMTRKEYEELRDAPNLDTTNGAKRT